MRNNISARIMEDIRLNEEASPMNFISEDMTIKEFLKFGDVRTGFLKKINLSGYTDEEIMDLMILTRKIHGALGITQIIINEEEERRGIEAQTIFSRERAQEREAPIEEKLESSGNNNEILESIKHEDRLYNKFMEIISYFSNEEIEKLANSLIEYVKNDEEM